jgi:hypothetical protein
MTNENAELVAKIGIIFGLMIVGMVTIVIGSNLENLWVSGFGGGLFVLAILLILSILRNI